MSAKVQPKERKHPYLYEAPQDTYYNFVQCTTYKDMSAKVQSIGYEYPYPTYVL